ncbi:MAG: hypothetical protein A3K04_02350 [Gallionellales bacterium RBG_16_56_9]|nr:MAG: hypothetical protein A3K04_02350 [Gallionellales bacterium RBG_16_56_9]
MRADIDRQITALYQQQTKKGAVKEFCQKYGLQTWQVRRRALKLGVVQLTKKESVWTEAEIDLLGLHYYKTPSNIARIFRHHGYPRSETAIVVKRKRLGLRLTGTDIYSARGIARIMGVECKTVTHWIARGLLHATRRGTRRTELQGGDMHQITHRAAREFIRDNVAIIDLRKIDKFWLVDLLANTKEDL